MSVRTIRTPLSDAGSILLLLTLSAIQIVVQACPSASLSIFALDLVVRVEYGNERSLVQKTGLFVLVEQQHEIFNQLTVQSIA